MVVEVLDAIGETDKGLAMFSHEYRRTMKTMGLAPTNSSIVTPVDETFGATKESSDMEI